MMPFCESFGAQVSDAQSLGITDLVNKIPKLHQFN
jgi:hypothetical protein